MHKAVARDILMKSGWSEPQIRMALRIMAYDGARDAASTPEVIAAFAKRCEIASERAAWLELVERLRDEPRQAQALWALRQF